MHWRRTGTNFDTESLNRKRVHTLCADIALGQILISRPPPNKQTTCTVCWRRTGPNLLIEMLTKRRLHCAGIAMDRILILKLRRKMPTCPTYLPRTRSTLILELHAKNTYPDLCAGVTLSASLMLEPLPLTVYAHFALSSHWVHFGC